MFRPIRRKKNEINIGDAKNILKEARIGILAVNGDNDYPYAIPVNYYYDETNNRIYFHGSRAGHKVDSIKKCDKICFTVCGPEIIRKETWAPFVQSVVVFGRCHIVDDSLIAKTKLKQFAMKYYPNEQLVNEEILISGNVVQMYEIEIEHISGKEVQEK